MPFIKIFFHFRFLVLLITSVSIFSFSARASISNDEKRFARCREGLNPIESTAFDLALSQIQISPTDHQHFPSLSPFNFDFYTEWNKIQFGAHRMESPFFVSLKSTLLTLRDKLNDRSFITTGLLQDLKSELSLVPRLNRYLNPSEDTRTLKIAVQLGIERDSFFITKKMDLDQIIALTEDQIASLNDDPLLVDAKKIYTHFSRNWKSDVALQMTLPLLNIQGDLGERLSHVDNVLAHMKKLTQDSFASGLLTYSLLRSNGDGLPSLNNPDFLYFMQRINGHFQNFRLNHSESISYGFRNPVRLGALAFLFEGFGLTTQSLALINQNLEDKLPQGYTGGATTPLVAYWAHYAVQKQLGNSPSFIQVEIDDQIQKHIHTLLDIKSFDSSLSEYDSTLILGYLLEKSDGNVTIPAQTEILRRFHEVSELFQSLRNQNRHLPKMDSTTQVILALATDHWKGQRTISEILHLWTKSLDEIKGLSPVNSAQLTLRLLEEKSKLSSKRKWTFLKPLETKPFPWNILL